MAAYEVDSLVFDDGFMNEWVKKGLRSGSIDENRLDFLNQEAIDALKQRL